MIFLSQVDKSYAKRVLLKGATLHVRAGEKVGLVGVNGSGKTTLLRLIVGLDEPDSGTVAVRKGARVGYLPQEVLSFSGPRLLSFIMDAEHAVAEARVALRQTQAAFDEAQAKTLETGEADQAEMVRLADQQGEIFDELARLGGFDLEARAKKVAAGLGFTAADLERPVESFSGGWMMRAALARLLLAAPDVLLLDEPTNHLDLDSLVWLEEFLRGSKAAVLLVSHDRTFIDRLVGRIVEVEAGVLNSFPGDYEAYLAEKERRVQELLSAYEAQRERIEQVQRFIDRNRVRKDRARQVQARIRMLEKMERIEPPALPGILNFQFPAPPRTGDMVLEVTNLTKGFGDRKLYGGLSLSLRRGERLALLGANGTGKTTLLKLLAGRLEPEAGAIRYGSNVRAGYFAQDQVNALDQSHTVFEEMATVAGPDTTQGQLRTLLGAFMFSGEEALKKVSVLSGGERSRLSLCKLLLEAPNLLLLDEPTNHLDIASRDCLERALESYRGTLVIATHDRRLMNRLASKVLSLEGGAMGCAATLYEGNYDDWLRLSQQVAQQAAAQAAACPAPSAAAEPAPAKGRRADRELKALEARWRQEKSRRTAPLRARADDLLSRIEAAEQEVAELDAALARPETYDDHARARELADRQRGLKAQLERTLVPEWERTSLELEELERAVELERPRPRDD